MSIGELEWLTTADESKILMLKRSTCKLRYTGVSRYGNAPSYHMKINCKLFQWCPERLVHLPPLFALGDAWPCPDSLLHAAG